MLFKTAKSSLFYDKHLGNPLLVHFNKSVFIFLVVWDDFHKESLLNELLVFGKFWTGRFEWLSATIELFLYDYFNCVGKVVFAHLLGMRWYSLFLSVS